eukprot:764216-Hanusia_phi.AAC.1
MPRHIDICTPQVTKPSPQTLRAPELPPRSDAGADAGPGGASKRGKGLAGSETSRRSVGSSAAGDVGVEETHPPIYRARTAAPGLVSLL